MLRFIGYLLGSQVVLTLLGVVSGAIVNRSLGPSGRGDYAELMSWGAILVAVFGLSAPSAIFHFAAHQHLRRELLGSVLAVWAATTAGGLLVTLGAYALPWHVGSSNFRSHLGLVLLWMAGALAVASLDALLKVAEAFRLLAAAAVIVAVATVGTTLALALAAQLTVSKLLLLNGSGQLLLGGIYLGGLVRRDDRWFPPRARLRLSFDVVGAGAKLHLATVSTLLYVRIDQVWLFNLAGAVETGYYAVAVTIAMQAMLVPLAVQQVLYSRFATNSVADEAAFSLRTTRLALIAFGGSLVVLGLLAGPVVTLYAGQAYGPAVLLLRGLLVGVFFFSIPSLLSPYWVKRGKFLLASSTALVVLVINLALNYLLIPRFAALGATLATDGTYMGGMIISLFVFQHLSGRNPWRVFAPTRSDLDLLRKLWVERAQLRNVPLPRTTSVKL